MAQTTGATTARAAVVEVSTNGSSWTDISGMANTVDDPSQSRMSGEVYTFDGDTAIIGAGKREPIELGVTITYTEGASDAFEVVRAAFEAATTFYVRYTVKAASTGNFRYTSDGGVITEFNYPAIDAASGDPITCDFTLKTAKTTKAAIP